MDISHIKSLDMALSVNMLYLQAMKKRENYDNLDLGVHDFQTNPYGL